MQSLKIEESLPREFPILGFDSFSTGQKSKLGGDGQEAIRVRLMQKQKDGKQPLVSRPFFVRRSQALELFIAL